MINWFIYTGSHEGAVVIYDAVTGEPVKRLQARTHLNYA